MTSVFLQKLAQWYSATWDSLLIQLHFLPPVRKCLEHCAQTCTLLPRHVSCPRGLWGTQDFWDLRRAPKAKLTDMRCKPSVARLNTAMKGTYPVLLASKHSAGCQRVYEKEILSNTPPLTLTWVYYSYMPTHPNLKLMLFQSRPAQK